MSTFCRRLTAFPRFPPAGPLRSAFRRQSTASSQRHASIITNLLKTPVKTIDDYLSPTPSRLLEILLQDLLPARDHHSPPAALSPSPLPQGHHLAYFPLLAPPSRLAPDGADADHWPGHPYNRRLWASGRLDFARRHPETLTGARMVCHEEIVGAEIMSPGTPGENVRVDIRRRYGFPREPDTGHLDSCAFEERRCLRFMQDKPPHDPQPAEARAVRPYSKVPAGTHTFTPSPLHLFQFSALSFNAHYIHYDHDYASRVDGHKDRLVQAPLSLALLLRAATAQAGMRARSISYRNLRPLYANEPMTVCWKPRDGRTWEVWILGPSAELAVGSTVEFFT